jgi:hypothetical protein
VLNFFECVVTYFFYFECVITHFFECVVTLITDMLGSLFFFIRDQVLQV